MFNESSKSMHKVSSNTLCIVSSIAFLFIVSSVPAAFAESPIPSIKAIELDQQLQLMTSAKNLSFAGYVGNAPSGMIRKITAAFVVPQITCRPLLANSQYVAQVIGIQGGPSDVYLAIVLAIWCLPGQTNAVWLPEANFANFTYGEGGMLSMPETIVSGDLLVETISVNLATNQVTSGIKDVTKGDSASTTIILEGSNKITNALWAITSGTIVAKFSPVKFSSASIVTSAGKTLPISKLSGLTELTLVDSAGATLAKTSTLSRAGNSFTVTFVRFYLD